jgi:hypothetical protein
MPVQEDHEFKASLTYIARPCLKKEKNQEHSTDKKKPESKGYILGWGCKSMVEHLPCMTETLVLTITKKERRKERKVKLWS